MEKPPDLKDRLLRRLVDPDYRSEIIITDADSDLANRPRTASTRIREFAIEQYVSFIKAVLRIAKHLPLPILILAFSLFVDLFVRTVFHDPKFLGVLPVRYLFEAGDVGVIITLFIVLIRDLLREDDNGKKNT